MDILPDLPILAGPADEELMQVILEGDEQALNQFYERHRALIFKIVLQILPVQADAEETVQDIFAEIWAKASKFDAEKGKALGWLICMARRREIDRVRKSRRRLIHETSSRERNKNDHEQTLSLEPVLSPDAEGGQNAATKRDLCEFLAVAIRKLPAEQGQVLHLTYFEDLTQREIAARTGVPLGTIKIRQELAMHKLTARFAPSRRELKAA